MNKISPLLILLMISISGYSKTNSLKKDIISAYKSGLRYSIVPWLKEQVFIKRGNISTPIDQILTRIVLKVGAQNFEGLDKRILVRSGANSLRYIGAKKLVKEGKYSQAQTLLSQISSNSLLYPFSQNYLATLSYIQNNLDQSISYYEQCVSSSASKMSKDDEDYKQFKINRDICLTGKARVYYAKKNYKKADDLYLDLEKKSIVWPPVLLEEAWSSFYAQNFNRTLGKLVTYNAPELRYITNPEIYVLKAMTYLKMCLYGDVQKVVEKFYSNYESSTALLEKEIASQKDNNLYFYNQLVNYKSVTPEQRMYFYKGIYKLPNIRSFIDNIKKAELEKRKVSRYGKRTNELHRNIQEFSETQKKVIGLQTQNKLNKLSYDLRKSFQSMSYMKLEVLGRKKEAIYEGKDLTGKRGDVKYLKRSDRQYFWNFIGEFWGDELGDYVFTLPVECPDAKN